MKRGIKVRAPLPVRIGRYGRGIRTSNTRFARKEVLMGMTGIDGKFAHS
ncbi:MAG: hypothetical protein RI947_1464 [Candidatus Parcubacteria bacterium]